MTSVSSMIVQTNETVYPGIVKCMQMFNKNIRVWYTGETWDKTKKVQTLFLCSLFIATHFELRLLSIGVLMT